VSILKYAADRIAEQQVQALPENAIRIVTHGAHGLGLKQGGRGVNCPAIAAPMVRDSCGSGDMVTIGLIDWVLRGMPAKLTIEAVLAGVVAGQRLAAANCAFIGARGLIQRRGASAARAILDNEAGARPETGA
jgi:fructokinase